MESTEESYRTGQHFNSTLSFRKINRQIRSQRMESLESEQKERSSTPNTTEVRQSYTT